MPDKRRVLIFPAGSEIGLEIYHALKYSHHLDVYGASGKSDHAAFLYPADHYVEDDRLYVDQPDFLDRFNSHLTRLGISFIYPTHDTIAWFLAEHAGQLAAQVIGSCADTNRVARFKSKTYQHLSAAECCPAVYGSPDEVATYPVFLKPDDGQGGKGTFRADSPEELAFHLQRHPALLITEYLPGDELSVDCFTDYHGVLRFIGPRTRERVQMGISFRSARVAVCDEIRAMAETINGALALNGAWFFQAKRDGRGRYKLLELAPRQASTMGLYRHAGVNFALLSYFNAQRMAVDIQCNDYELTLDRCLHNRFQAGFSYQRVYIDFDETIIDGDQVHDRVMAFLYQCRNQRRDIVLLTKHRHDLQATLQRLCIAPGLFSEIIHLSDDQEKWRYIDPAGAIFIDNYWADRQAVRRQLGIPVFDVDAVECLLR